MQFREHRTLDLHHRSGLLHRDYVAVPCAHWNPPAGPESHPRRRSVNALPDDEKSQTTIVRETAVGTTKRPATTHRRPPMSPDARRQRRSVEVLDPEEGTGGLDPSPSWGTYRWSALGEREGAELLTALTAEVAAAPAGTSAVGRDASYGVVSKRDEVLLGTTL